MKQSIFTAVLIALVISSFQASAQSRRYNQRHDNRYDNRRVYPSRPSVSVVASLPFGSVAVSFGRRNYHYYDGYYYSPYNQGYMMVNPPVGIVVPALPQGGVMVMVGLQSYYRFQSVFYLPLGNSQYQVVEKPAEPETVTVKKESQSEYEKITLDGKTYYRKDDKYFKATVDDDGEINYQEVGGPTK